MSASTDDPAEAAYVEEVGRYFDGLGWPRMAGRLVGALMVADPREQSAAELADRLHASRGSISTTSRLLISVGLAERHTRRGDRRDYYRLKDDAWISTLQARIGQLHDLHGLGTRGLAVVPEDGAARGSLAALVDLCEFYERELPALNERWRRDWAAREGSAE
jgi:hypothetical protein